MRLRLSSFYGKHGFSGNCLFIWGPDRGLTGWIHRVHSNRKFIDRLVFIMITSTHNPRMFIKCRITCHYFFFTSRFLARPLKYAEKKFYREHE